MTSCTGDRLIARPNWESVSEISYMARTQLVSCQFIWMNKHNLHVFCSISANPLCTLSPYVTCQHQNFWTWNWFASPNAWIGRRNMTMTKKSVIQRNGRENMRCTKDFSKLIIQIFMDQNTAILRVAFLVLVFASQICFTTLYYGATVRNK